MTKNNIISTFITLCSTANSAEELVRGYINTFGEEIKKFGKAKVDDMNQPMISLYNFINGWEFKKKCAEGGDSLWDFIDCMVTYAEVYIWHKDKEDNDEEDDRRIAWIKQFL